MKRIKWARGQWSLNGRVNGLAVFSVGWGISSDRENPYTLNSALPGVPVTQHPDESTAKKHAEIVLKLIVEKLGAKFPEES